MNKLSKSVNILLPKGANPKVDEVAKKIVKFSCSVKQGEKVMINYVDQDTEELANAVVNEVTNRSIMPFVQLDVFVPVVYACIHSSVCVIT